MNSRKDAKMDKFKLYRTEQTNKKKKNKGRENLIEKKSPSMF